MFMPKKREAFVWIIELIWHFCVFLSSIQISYYFLNITSLSGRFRMKVGIFIFSLGLTKMMYISGWVAQLVRASSQYTKFVGSVSSHSSHKNQPMNA